MNFLAKIRAGFSANAATLRRDERIDFLRGLALLVIFVDHVPYNIFEPYTLHAFSFADAAEVFFFISGYVAALVYGGVMAKKGFFAAARKVLRRAAVVYSAQFLLLALILTEVGVYMLMNGDRNPIAPFRIFQVFDQPLEMLGQALILRFQPAYLDILPTYVLLLLFFPLALAGLARNVWYVLIPSFALWLAVQVFGLNLTITIGENWFFNPFAWQFLFVLGAVFGSPRLKAQMAFLDSRILFRVAVVLVAVIAVVQLSSVLQPRISAIPSLRPDFLPIDKSPLQPLRIVSLFTLALVVSRYLPPRGVLLRYWPSLLVVWCGQSSLQVFSFGALLSSFTLLTSYFSGQNPWLQTTLCILGVGLQFVFAAYLQWSRNGGRLLPAATGQDVAVEGVERPSTERRH
jgi:hypothetical protein